MFALRLSLESGLLRCVAVCVYVGEESWLIWVPDSSGVGLGVVWLLCIVDRYGFGLEVGVLLGVADGLECGFDCNFPLCVVGGLEIGVERSLMMRNAVFSAID